VTLTSTGSQSITATDGGITGSANTTVAPHPHALQRYGSGECHQRRCLQRHGDALDASNVIVPSYTGTVHFTSSSAG